MTKKLLSTAIGMILAGGVAVAQADVQVMGHIDESFIYANGGGVSGSGVGSQNFYDGTHGTPALITKGDSNSQFVCTTCSIGFKGSEDLGNGLKALFFLDWEYDINGNGAYGNAVNGGLTGRDQWLGMAGSFGRIKAGTMSTVYKAYGAQIDPVYDTVAQQRNIGIQSNLHNGRGDSGQGRATNTVGYDSPDWNGLKLNATYTVVPDSSTLTPDGSHPNPFSAGVNYENGGLLGYVAYISNMTGDDDSAAEIGAKYTFNNFAIFGQYELDKGLITDSVTNTLGQQNNGDGANVWMVGGSYTMGNNLLYAGYGQGDNAKTTDNALAAPGNVSRGSYKSWEVIGVHNFSKRTYAYLGYIGQTLDDKASFIDPATGTSVNKNVDTLGLYTLGLGTSF